MQADPKKVNKLLNNAKGQLDAVYRMVEEGCYCVEISNQILATIALLKKANNYIVAEHIKHCVLDSKGTAEEEKKLEEVEKLLNRMTN